MKPKDKTVGARMKKQRDARIAAGWKEVRVWVPTEEDAKEIQKLAEEKRRLVPNPSKQSAIWLRHLADLSKD